MPAKAEIKVVLCEYIVRNILKPAPGTLVFAKMSDEELRALCTRLPDHEVRATDSDQLPEGWANWDKTGERSVFLLSIDEITIRGSRARAYAGFTSGKTSTTVTYDFQLEMDEYWRVRGARKDMVAY